MITGLHAIIYSGDAEKNRAFLRDVLSLTWVDAGHGWLIFAAPPAELAVHPTEEHEKPRRELYLMCDDLRATMRELADKGVQCSAISEARWAPSPRFICRAAERWDCISQSTQPRCTCDIH
jgi:hypothetical protein